MRARPGPLGQVSRDETILDPELKGDDPKTDPIDFMLTQGPPYNVSSIPHKETEDKLKDICRLYKIPALVEVIVVSLGEDPARPPNEAVAMAERFFECGLTILFPLFFQEIISKMVLALSQLCPNIWPALLGCFVIWNEMAFPLFSFAELAQCYYIKKCPVEDKPNVGFYYFSTHLKQLPLVTGNPSMNGSWQK